LAKVPNLRIPERAIPRLRDFAHLSDDQASELLTALEKTSPTVSPNTLSVTLKRSLPHFDKEQSEEFLSALFNLLAVSASHGWNLRDVAETVAQSPDLEISEEQGPRFAERLYSAIITPSVFNAANAADVATEYDALYHTARVFTDVRSAPSTEFNRAEVAAVITNTLKIDYFTSNDSRAFTITLSTEDIRELVDILNAAVASSNRIRDALKGSRLTVFEFGENAGEADGSTS
jgi:hypothetical protein